MKHIWFCMQKSSQELIIVSILFAAGQHTSNNFKRGEEGGAIQSGRGRNPLSQGTAVFFAVGAGRLQVTRQHLAGEWATKVFTLSVTRALHNSSPVIMSAWHGKTHLCCSGTNQMSVIMASFWHTVLWRCSWANSVVTFSDLIWISVKVSSEMLQVLW